MRARSMPEDFREHATEGLRALADRYHVGTQRITAWRRALGVTVPAGAPKGNGNAIRNSSRGKQTHGMDGIEVVRTCLSCKRPRCSGSCDKVH